VDRNRDVIAALANAPGGQLKYCTLKIGDILDEESGSLVSPANSKGDMGGGIDLAYSERFPHIEDRLRTYIMFYFGNNLEIGQAVVVPTLDPRFPYIVASPTVALAGDAATGESVYKAMKAALTESLLYNKKMIATNSPSFSMIRHLLMPGLGTGSGGLSPEIAARSMRAAYGAVEANLPKILETSVDPISVISFGNYKASFQEEPSGK
jgi:O-acetyl-ADP-ribose deacetylase (regulator of RNase III)